VSLKELEYAQNAVGEFGGDNRAGIEGTLHRISAIRSRKGMIVGLTCRVGRVVSGHVDMVYDLLQYGKSILFVGKYVCQVIRNKGTLL
jgi:stage III sporulation protein SpoIIIAA